MKALLLTVSFEDITSLVMFVFGILSLILFFKIWGMTNDVNAIREHLCRKSISHKKIEDLKFGAKVYVPYLNKHGILKSYKDGLATVEIEEEGDIQTSLDNIEEI